MTWQKRFLELIDEWRKDYGWHCHWKEDNAKLPYELFMSGYHLYFVYEHLSVRGIPQYYGAALIKGNIVENEWKYLPSPSELFDYSKEAI